MPCPHHDHMPSSRTARRGYISSKALLCLLLLLSLLVIAYEHFEIKTSAVQGRTVLVLGTKDRPAYGDYARPTTELPLVRTRNPHLYVPTNGTAGPAHKVTVRHTILPNSSQILQGHSNNDSRVVAQGNDNAANSISLQVSGSKGNISTSRPSVGQNKPSMVTTTPVHKVPTSTLKYTSDLTWGTYFQRKSEKVNPYTHSNMINEQSLCYTDVTGKPKPAPKLLFLVLSSPENADNRKFIRRTWGKSVTYSKFNVQTVFLCGKSLNPEHNNQLAQESQIYHDIIQDDFDDTYFNLTYKTLMGLRWSGKYCAVAPYVMKTDDDMILNVDLIFLTAQIMSGDADGVLMGFRYRRAPVKRNGRWAVTEEQYPFGIYPDYTAGVGYLMSRDVAATLTFAAEYVPLFPMEDVYVTGILPQITGIHIHNANNFPRWLARSSDKLNFHNGNLIGVHKMTLAEKYSAWKMKYGSTLDP